jgi:hypothetical protein
MGTLTDIFAAPKAKRFAFLRDNFIRIFYQYHHNRFSIRREKLRSVTIFLDSQISKPIDIDTTAQFIRQHRPDIQEFMSKSINEVIQYGNVQFSGGFSPHSANLVRDIFADEDSLIVNVNEGIVIEIIDFLCNDLYYPLLCDICFACTCQVIAAAHKNQLPISIKMIKPPTGLLPNHNQIISCSNWGALVQYASADVVLKLCGIPWLDEIPSFPQCSNSIRTLPSNSVKRCS